MTHYAVIVLTETGTEEEIDRLLAPYDEDGEWGRDGSRWDWWTVGGRYTGLLDGYEPEADPANVKVCDLCGGTGDRAGWRHEPRARQHPTGCNGCLGTGQAVKWSTEWADHPGDRAPARAIDPASLPYLPTIVAADGSWHEPVDGGYGWFGLERGPRKDDAAYLAEIRDLLSAKPDAIAVVVDCHV